MERVWEELKKIEAQAEQIRSEAQNRSKEIVNIAQQESEKLFANTKTYAQEEAQHLKSKTIQEASNKHDEKLKANVETTEKLKQQAQKRMERAAKTIAEAVLEGSVHETDSTVR